MFDMSWGEVMVIGAVALIVIGPKDLPKALRTVGQMTTKIRRMAGEFQSQFNEAMREAELDDLKKEIDGINKSVGTATTAGFNPIQTIRDELKGAVDGVPATSDPAPLAATDIEPTLSPQATESAIESAHVDIPALPTPEPVVPAAPHVPDPVVAPYPIAEPPPAAETYPEPPKAKSA